MEGITHLGMVYWGLTGSGEGGLSVVLSSRSAPLMTTMMMTIIMTVTVMEMLMTRNMLMTVTLTVSVSGMVRPPGP
jgi:hypothetical protein